MDSIRLDRWLWSVRLFKTRSVATEACRSGHLAVNRGVTKPSSLVRVGVDCRDRILEVARVIDRRVSASVATECVVDRSPPPALRSLTAPGLMRDRFTGRPTKKDRRLIDHLRHR